jgi:hypothetical protein
MAGDVNYKDTLSQISAEEEWLMNRNSKWVITHAELVNGVWMLKVVKLE